MLMPNLSQNNSLIPQKEIKALFRLLDDPDQDVYNAVSDKIVSIGKDIIPKLENYWESITDLDTQERIELLIHRLHMRELTEDFLTWKDGEGSLLEGALLVARYHYPELNVTKVKSTIEKIRKNIWLELNNYLTPIEKINVFNSIYYNYYKHKGIEISYDSPDAFLVNKTLESKKGNGLSNGIIYLVLCSLLDLPVHAVNIPRQFVLAYFDKMPGTEEVDHPSAGISFYLDPASGQLYSNKDIENYFRKLSVPPVASYFRPLDNKRVIQYLLEELSKCYDNDKNSYKMTDLLFFANMLEP